MSNYCLVETEFPPMFSVFLQQVREVRIIKYLMVRLCNNLAKTSAVWDAWDDYLTLNAL